MRGAKIIVTAALVVGGCGGTPSPAIKVVGEPKPSAVEVRGLPSSDLRALAAANLTTRDWQDIFRVSLYSGSQNAMAGDYRIEGSSVWFTPMFGFDAGRSFTVTFAPERVPGAAPADWRRTPVSHAFSVLADEKPPSTTVRQVYPSAAELPENTLRFYIEFSGPMGRGDALPHIRLVDEDGREVVDPFLPVEAEFWSPDRTRFTLFFDPGRVKRGIKPNRDLGRALIAGRRYALVVDDQWTDGNGVPLKEPHRHAFTATAPIERALDPKGWAITAPSPGDRDPLIVVFPWSLDHGLLQRSMTVRGPGGPVEGEARLEAHETRWLFVPAEPWRAGAHTLEAAPHLEDPAGNRLGRAFEVMERAAEPSEPAQVSFVVRRTTLR